MMTKRFCIVRVVAIAIIPAVIATLPLASGQQEQQRPETPQASQQHRILHSDVGTWDAEITLFPPEEGAAPMKSKGSEKCELLPGGMWLVSRFDGEMMGMQFAGVGTFGYDPVEKKYVGTWIETMSPHLMIIKGEYDEATRTMTSTGEGRDYATGKPFTAKLVTRNVDANTRTFEMHMPGPDGKHVKMMEIKYKRRAK
jgi:hypothetical protein